MGGMFLRIVLSGLLATRVPQCAGTPSSIVGWYNGDRAVPGIAGWSNNYLSVTDFAHVYDDFVVPAGGWTVVGVFSNNSLIGPPPVTRHPGRFGPGMAPGFGGDLVASGLSPATQVSNPKTGDYQTAGAADPKPTRGVRVASIAVDGVSGELYATWHDRRFSGGLRDGIRVFAIVGWRIALAGAGAGESSAFAGSLHGFAGGGGGEQSVSLVTISAATQPIPGSVLNSHCLIVPRTAESRGGRRRWACPSICWLRRATASAPFRRLSGGAGPG